MVKNYVVSLIFDFIFINVNELLYVPDGREVSGSYNNHSI